MIFLYCIIIKVLLSSIIINRYGSRLPFLCLFVLFLYIFELLLNYYVVITIEREQYYNYYFYIFQLRKTCGNYVSIHHLYQDNHRPLLVVFVSLFLLYQIFSHLLECYFSNNNFLYIDIFETEQ